jgi:lipopolysaccharide/colanic/teichoic acid biosynthesis glycosyltransferase
MSNVSSLASMTGAAGAAPGVAAVGSQGLGSASVSASGLGGPGPAAVGRGGRVAPWAPIAPGARPIKPVRRLRTLYSQEQADNAIHRERCRADRTGLAFALVLFRMPRSLGASRSLLRLARTVLTRSRTTDEVGWYDDHTVCALLPDTAAEGATRFADNVAGAFEDPSQRPQVTVYTYPGTWGDPGGTPLPTGTTGHAAPVGPVAAGSSTDPKPARRSAAELMPFVSRGLTQTLHERGQLAAGQVAVANLGTGSITAAGPFAPEDGVGLSAAAARPLTVLLAHPMPWWKRGMDVAGALFGLLAFSPVFLAVALAIRFTDPGPVFFRQRRAGLGGRPFQIVKFRTMCVDAEAKKQALRARSEQDGPAFKLTHDPRVTGIGRLLRKTSLDELPQLWNVLKGDMSLVGPRPLPIDEQGNAERWQQTRLDVTPGLTCVWQVEGRSTVTFAEWVRMDVKYIHRRTIWHDLKILFRTIPAVVCRRGAR